MVVQVEVNQNPKYVHNSGNFWFRTPPFPLPGVGNNKKTWKWSSFLISPTRKWFSVFESTAYETIGCYKDRLDRAIPILEGKDPILDGGYTQRIKAIEKCYEAARKRGFKVFAVQNGGQCFSSATAENTYDKHGASSACRVDGEGAAWANQVYFIRGKMSEIFIPTHSNGINFWMILPSKSIKKRKMGVTSQ